MATNMTDDEKAFADAFNEDLPAAAEPTEDEAFGLAEKAAELPPEPETAQEVKSEDGDGNEGEGPAVAIVVDGDDMEAAADQAGAKDSAEAAAEQTDPVAIEAEPEMPKVDIEKEVQRLKSWEGRLKAMEAKLKSAGADTEEEQAAAVSEAIEQAAETTDSVADEEKVEQIAEQVEDGQITPQQAMKQLAEDFGDDFVRMIEAIATAKAKEAGGQIASEKFGELSKTVDEVINEIVDTKAKTHFETIADKHPDFQDIGASEQFKAYIEALPEGEKDQAMQVVANGSAKQIIKLLDGFKARVPAAKAELTEAKGESIVDEVSDEQLDAAEGVRSKGMKLPEQPSGAAGYEDAWDDF